MSALRSKERPAWFYRLVLIAATAVWGGNFVICKDAVSQLHSNWFISIRFAIAGILLALIFLPRMRKAMNKELLVAGCAIGFFTFLGYGSQFLGLMGTTPSKNAFLSACYCVTVPFIWWIVKRRKPTAGNLLAAAVCVLGMGFVTLEGDLSISWGDGVSILSAVLYGTEIVAIALLIKDHDLIAITAIQMFSCGVYAAIFALLSGTPFSTEAFSSPSFLAELAYAILLSSCFASTAQNLAQTKIPPAQVSLLFSLESVFATVFSLAFYGEALTAKTLVGFALIFVAILVSELRGDSRDSSSGSQRAKS